MQVDRYRLRGGGRPAQPNRRLAQPDYVTRLLILAASGFTLDEAALRLGVSTATACWDAHEARVVFRVRGRGLEARMARRQALR